MLKNSIDAEGVTGRLLAIAGKDKELFLRWMQVAPPNELGKAIKTALSGDPGLAGWMHSERRRFFKIWHQRGDRKELMEQIKSEPGWAQDAWPVVAADLAMEKNFRDAWTFASAHIQLTPPTSNMANPGLPILRTMYSVHKNPETAELFTKALYLKNDWDGVKRMASTDPCGPVLRMASLASANLNEWAEAWKYLVEAIRQEDDSFTPE